MFKTDCDKSLSQGDIFTYFNDPVLPKQSDELALILISNTCDIEQKKLKYYLYCPIYNLDSYIDPFIKNSKNNQSKLIRSDKIRKEEGFKNHTNKIKSLMSDIMNNNRPRMFFLSPRVEWGEFLAFAELEQIRSITKDKKEEILKNRFACLKNPWRERLGYKIAYLFNRVALPDYKKSDFNQFYNNKYQEKFKSYFKLD